MGQFDHRLDDQPAVAGPGDIGDERLVDLDLGEGQLPQLHQRRIAGAEIVDREADALDAEASQRVHQLDQGLGCPFGQLEHQPVGRNLQAPAHALDQVREIELLQAERGDVERDRRIDALVAPVEPLPQHRAQPPQGQLVDQPVALGQRHEARRLDRAELGIIPADQRLDPLQLAVLERHLGLVDHAQLVALHGALQALHQLGVSLPHRSLSLLSAGRAALRAPRAGPASPAARPSTGRAPRRGGRRIRARGGRTR